MYFTQRKTKTSVQVLVDGEGSNRLANAAKELAGAYDFKLIEESFFAAAEFYLDLNLAPQERRKQISEILEVVKRNISI